MMPPPKIGRIPRKIGSQNGFSTITADEWKNWIILYSVFALDGILPPLHFQCWCLFVKACRLVCQLVINDDDIQSAHEILLQFCNAFEHLYGKESCTPNMHLACHLRESLIDYGPLAAFSAYSFECYNGALERIKTSWNGPEKQVLNKIVSLQSLEVIQIQVNNEFYSLVCSKSVELSLSSVELMSYDATFLISHSLNYNCPVHQIDATAKACYKFLPPSKEKCFTEYDVTNLHHVYNLLYPQSEICTFGYFYFENKRMLINGEEYITTRSQSKCSSAIVAHWLGTLGIDEQGVSQVRVGIVTAFIQHSIVVKEQSILVKKDNVLAHVKWFQDHPQRHSLHDSIIISANIII